MDPPSFNPKELKGFKYFRFLGPLLQRLHDNATARDKAGNRLLHYDHYAALILFSFFNPILTSLKGLQQASTLDKVQKALGCPRTSVGSLSEAARVFDADLLRELLAELVPQVAPATLPKEREALKDLTAVDGSLLPALPRMAWALWLDDDHRVAKMHLAFEVFRAIPTDVRVTDGNASERQQLRAMLQPGRLYAIDRGYAEYQLFQDIIDGSSSFIGRLRENAVWQLVEARPLTAEARAAGVRSDRVVWLGCEQSGQVLRQPLRVVEVATGKKDGRGQDEVLLLVTERLDLAAELVGLGYRYRWAVELFFRWFKCILGCRHLLSTCQGGVSMQVYLGLIASLLISLWTGQKPSKRTYEMVCFCFASAGTGACLRGS